ncbi:MAG: hypothetical protein HYU69_04010 [Bacteroidetes bacterium]|nr:hypothetical protein [Bacteroidota bacterium]
MLVSFAGKQKIPVNIKQSKGLFFTFCTFILLSYPCNAQCKSKLLTGICKLNLGEFLYDSFEISKFDYSDVPQTIHVQFMTYKASRYKVLFCTGDQDDHVQVNIYDKDVRVRNRKKVYDSKQSSGCFWVFQPPHTGTYFIEYTIPPTAKVKQKHGCVVMIVGYQL